MIMIDFDKSINDKRLYIKTSFIEKFGVFCVWIIGSISLPFISLTMLYGSLKFNWFYESAIRIGILQIINFGISIFVIIGLIINRNLTMISIPSNIDSRLLLKDLMTNFKNAKIEKETDKELIVSIKNGFFSNYRQLIILIDKKIVANFNIFSRIKTCVNILRRDV